MISIFNGRRRALGQFGGSAVFAQVSVEFRTHLHAFKGAPLAVFMAIALHSDERGWASPSIAMLARETGFGKDAVSDALAYLCGLRIDGHRVLLRGQPRDHGGKFFNNSYLIFPTDEEVARHRIGVFRIRLNRKRSKPK